jgi:hypothetical protein
MKKLLLGVYMQNAFRDIIKTKTYFHLENRMVDVRGVYCTHTVNLGLVSIKL